MKTAYIVGDVVIVLAILSFIPFWKKDGNYVNLWSAIKPTDTAVTVINQYPTRTHPSIKPSDKALLLSCPAGMVRVRGGACVAADAAMFY